MPLAAGAVSRSAATNSASSRERTFTANAPDPPIRSGGTCTATAAPAGTGLSKSLPGLKVPRSVETWTDTDSGLLDGLVISTDVLRAAPARPPAKDHAVDRKSVV